MKRYYLGRRFWKFRNLCLLIVVTLVLGFYYIYEFFYGEQPWWNPKLAILAFVLLGVLFFGAAFLFLERIRSSFYYCLTDCGLKASLFGRTVIYPYQSFRRAYHRFGGVFDTLPVVFEFENSRKLELNPYTQDLSELTLRLFQSIEAYAELEEGIRAFAEAYAE